MGQDRQRASTYRGVLWASCASTVEGGMGMPGALDRGHANFREHISLLKNSRAPFSEPYSGV